MRQNIIDLYGAFTHGRMSRRAIMERMTALTGSAAAAIGALSSGSAGLLPSPWSVAFATAMLELSF